MQHISERSKNHTLLSISRVQNLIFSYLIETQTQNDVQEARLSFFVELVLYVTITITTEIFY